MEVTEQSEHDFWESPPRYSVTSVAPPLSLPPRPSPSRLRTAFAKLLFALILSAVLALLAYELMTVFGVSWGELRATLGI